MDTSDAVLVNKARNGDHDAFGELYDKFAALVRTICQDSEYDPLAAQDLSQEVFIRAYTKLDKLSDDAKFGPWLCSIARNVGREYRRSKARDRHVAFGTDSPEIEERTDSNADNFATMNAAMAKLSEQERMALHVHYLQERKSENEKVHEIMDMSRSSYYRLLEKAKENLSTIIEKEENGNENDNA